MKRPALRILTIVAAMVAAAVAPSAIASHPAEALEQPPVDVTSLDMLPLRIWGVSGQNPSQTQTPSLDVLVWDFAQIGDRMFVSGAFHNAQEAKLSTPIEQRFVAAFDVNTGDWIDTWRPVIDRPVYALEVSPTGSLLLGGEFENVNGTSRRGLVALDPVTGEIDTRFDGAVDRPWSTNRANVRDMEVVGNDLYVGGNFSHLDGPNGSRTQVWKSGRLDARWGNFDSSWKPVVGGSGIWGLSVDPVLGYVYLVGYFTSVNNEPNTGHFHTVDTTSGASVPGMIELPRNYPFGQLEMLDVTAVPGDKVFVVGEQHIVQVLDASDQQMLGYHHTGNRNDGFDWGGGFAGGAYQVSERIGDVVIAGCHCTYSVRNGWVNHYSSYTGQRTPHRLVMAYSATTGDIITEFLPDIQSPRDGAWAVASDTNGCVYLGGDYHVGGVDAGQERWLGGFAKLCPVDWEPPGPDVDPPSIPANLSATAPDADTVNLTWGPSSDDVAVQTYLIYRNGAYLGWTPAGTTMYTDTTVTAGVTYTYTVRAVDTSGNRSDLSDPATVIPGGPDVEPPTVPTSLNADAPGPNTVNLAWDPSTDNVAVQSYLIYRNGAYHAWTPDGATTYTDTTVNPGVTYTYTVRAVDTSGNRSGLSDPASVAPGGPDVDPPTVPTSLSADAPDPNTVNLTWDPSTDNVAIGSYLIYRNGAYHAWTPDGATTYTDTTVNPGVTYTYTVRAVDTSGNRSGLSDPASVAPGGPDVDPPTVPTSLSADAPDPNTVNLAWDPSTDNVAIGSYLVYRNGAYHAWTPAGTTTYTDSTVVPNATYTYTVRAVDTSGNRSAPSDGATVSPGGPDIDPPTEPANLAATSPDPNTVELAWDPSTDNVAVQSYLIYRNGAYHAWTPDGTTTYTDTTVTPGVTYTYTVRAVDTSANRSGLSNGAIVTP